MFENLDSNVDSLEPKPFKYSVGQKVILHFYGGEVSTITDAFNDGGVWNKYKVKMLPTRIWNENELDPYEEPETNRTKESDGSDHSVVKDEMVGNIIKDGFREHTRLHIAAMAMVGILGNANMLQYAINNFRLPEGTRNRYYAVAQLALAHADALIAEAEKGGQDEED